MNPDGYGYQAGYRDGQQQGRSAGATAQRKALAATLTELRNARGMLTGDESREYNAALDAVAKAHGLVPETTVRLRGMSEDERRADTRRLMDDLPTPPANILPAIIGMSWNETESLAYLADTYMPRHPVNRDEWNI